MNRSLNFLVPGDLQTLSGGYLYDRRMVEELGRQGWKISVSRLDASFPEPGSTALEHADRTLRTIPSHSLVLIDGLAFGAMPQVLQAHAQRLQLIALIHMPLAAEPGIDPERAWRRQRLELEALRSARHVIVTGQTVAAAWQQEPSLARKLTVIEPGTDEQVSAAPAQTGIVKMICVGTVCYGKGQDLLVEALTPLAALPWRLRCIGSLTRNLPEVHALQAQLRLNGIADRVTLMGELDPLAVSAQLLAADLFVLATRFESYCMAVAEAIAHGLPVVSTLTGAIETLVGPCAGLLVPVNDPDALRAALLRVLTEPAVLMQLTQGAGTQRHMLPGWKQAGERLSALLSQVDAHPTGV